MHQKDPIQADFDRIEQYLKRLDVEYNVYFQGGRKTPPEELRVRLDKLIRRYRNTDLRNFGDRFHFSTIMSSYTAHSERWRRRLEAKEGGVSSGPRRREPSFSGGGGQPLRRSAPSKSAVSKSSENEAFVFADPSSEGREVERLYKTYVSAKKNEGEATTKLTYQGFQKVISKQVTSIQKKSGVSKIQFRVQIKKGKVTLKAGRAKE